MELGDRTFGQARDEEVTIVSETVSVSTLASPGHLYGVIIRSSDGVAMREASGGYPFIEVTAIVFRSSSSAVTAASVFRQQTGRCSMASFPP